MSLKDSDPLAFVWTTVPSGMDLKTAPPFLRLRVMVAPDLHPEDMNPGELGAKLFADWPKKLREGVLKSFKVKFAQQGKDPLFEKECGIETKDLVADGVWKEVFPDRTVKPHEKLSSKAAPVDRRAMSYDPLTTLQQLRLRRGFDTMRAGASIVTLAMEKDAFKAKKINDLELLHVQQNWMSQLAWTRRPKEEAWAEIKLNNLELTSTLKNPLSAERRKKLYERNLYRLARKPEEQLREDVQKVIATLTDQGGTNVEKAEPLGPAPIALAELALFHSRVPPLVTRPRPKEEKPDFMEQMGLVRTHPYLALKLGLILEVHVTPTADQWKQLETGEWRVWVEPCWPETPGTSPSTWFKFDRASSHFFPREVIPNLKNDILEKDKDHQEGYLVLDKNKWELTTCEIDGSALKQLNEAEDVVGRMPPAITTDSKGRISAANDIALKLLTGSTKPLEPSSATLEKFTPSEKWPEVLRTLKDLFAIGLPGRSCEYTLALNKAGRAGLPLSCEFLITLRRHLDPNTTRFEWTGKLDVHADARPYQPIVGPVQRTVGLSLMRRDAGVDLATSTIRQFDLSHFAQKSKSPNANSPAAENRATEMGEPRLAAIDLILGYVPEIWAPSVEDGTKQWHSTTKRLETYPDLKQPPRKGEGHVSLGLAVTKDGAPANQASQAPPSDPAAPPLQGTASPALFVYNNESLGFPAGMKSGKLQETPLATDPDPGTRVVHLLPDPGTLPLVRYSHISKAPIEYAVRCRYIDVAGNTCRPKTDKPDAGSPFDQLITVRRQEPLDPPRILMNEPLNLDLHPGSGLQRLVATEEDSAAGRTLIPPKCTADRALRYGYVFGRKLGRRGGLSAIELDAYAEVPTVGVIDSSKKAPNPDPNKQEKLPAVPIARRRISKINDGYYYLPDPACLGVTFTVRTFYAAAYEMKPIVKTIYFYDSTTWPNANPIGIRVRRLAAGEIEPVVDIQGQNCVVMLPPAWTATVEISSVCSGRNWSWPAEHFAAAADFKWVFKNLKTTLESDLGNSPTSEQIELKAQHQLLFDAFQSLTEKVAKEQISLGQNPVTSPPAQVALVCPVQRPMYAPTLKVSTKPFRDLERKPNSSTIDLDLTAVADEKSTSEVTVSATWPRRDDNPQLVEPKMVLDHVDISTLKLPEPAYYLPTPSVWSAQLDLGSTRFRRVTYKISGLSRFTDCYDLLREELVMRNPAAITISHPNCSQLGCAPVEFIVPTLVWAGKEEQLADQPLAWFTSRAHYGIRVFLGRGWELGELLGVVLAPTLSEWQAWALNKGKKIDVPHATKVLDGLENSITRWGTDPLVDSALPIDLPCPSDFTGFKHVGANLHLPPFEASPPPPNPLQPGAAGDRASVEPLDPRRVAVVGYKPVFDKRRKLWYCDIGLNRIPSDGCFVRMVLARYQPKSLATLELSPPVLADFVQVRSDRVINVMRNPTAPRALRVIVRDPADAKAPSARRRLAKGVTNKFHIEIYQPCWTTGVGDAGWMLEDRKAMEDSNGMPGVLWSGYIPWPDTVGPRRLVIREIEQWPGAAREIFSTVMEL